MTVWGVDLGVRGFHAAGISDDGQLELFTYSWPLRGKVSDQPPHMRGHELLCIAMFIAPRLHRGDIVHIEEPPLAGSRNIRTFLKLAQSSAAVAVGAMHEGASVSFVPVDTWKKETVGRGGASKELVAQWLERTHPDYFAQCSNDPNFVDATAIAIRAAAARGLDQHHGELEAG